MERMFQAKLRQLSVAGLSLTWKEWSVEKSSQAEQKPQIVAKLSLHVSKCGENDCDSAEPDQGYSDAAEFTGLTDLNEVGSFTSQGGRFGDGFSPVKLV